MTYDRSKTSFRDTNRVPHARRAPSRHSSRALLLAAFLGTLDPGTPLAGASELFDRFEASSHPPFGARHPDAPPETDQFAFLVGEFDCLERRREPRPGAIWVEARGRWGARFVLNGWAIQDVYHSPTQTFLAMRYFDPARNAWPISFLQAPGVEAGPAWEGRLEESGMVVRRDIVLPDGTPAVVRLSFHDVTDRSFEWRNDTVVGEASVTTWTARCSRAEGASSGSAGAPGSGESTARPVVDDRNVAVDPIDLLPPDVPDPLATLSTHARPRRHPTT